MEIINVNKPSLPEQVDINTKNIELLAEKIKDVYVANITINNNATTVSALNIKNWVEGTKEGFVLDNTGKLFKIVAVSDNTIYIEYWATLVEGPQGPIGPQGPQGPIGPQGPQGQDGAGVQDISRINLQVGEANVIYDTEDGITVLGQGNILTDTGAQINPETEMNVPLIAGNGLTMDATEDGQHVDIHLSAETQNTLARTLKTPVAIPTETEIVGIGTNGSQLLIPKTELTQSNPNLLINGDFRVNQRGLTSYTTARGYTADRWINREASLEVTPYANGGCKLEKIATHTEVPMISQSIENFEHLLGKTVTISAKIKSNNVTGGVNISLYSANASYYGSIDLNAAQTGSLKYTTETGIVSTTITLPTTLSHTKLNAVIRFATSSVIGEVLELEYIKLEIGSVATPFSPRPYGEELALCQRYYQSFKIQTSGLCTNATDFYVECPLVTTLRTVGTLQVINIGNIRDNGIVREISQLILVNEYKSNTALLKATSTGLTQNTTPLIANCEFYIDAEIY